MTSTVSKLNGRPLSISRKFTSELKVVYPASWKQNRDPDAVVVSSDTCHLALTGFLNRTVPSTLTTAKVVSDSKSATTPSLRKRALGRYHLRSVVGGVPAHLAP